MSVRLWPETLYNSNGGVVIPDTGWLLMGAFCGPFTGYSIIQLDVELALANSGHQIVSVILEDFDTEEVYAQWNLDSDDLSAPADWVELVCEVPFTYTGGYLIAGISKVSGSSGTVVWRHRDDGEGNILRQTKIWGVMLPFKPKSPTPSNAATGKSLNTATLSWQAGTS